MLPEQVAFDGIVSARRPALLKTRQGFQRLRRQKLSLFSPLPPVGSGSKDLKAQRKEFKAKGKEIKTPHKEMKIRRKEMKT